MSPDTQQTTDLLLIVPCQDVAAFGPRLIHTCLSADGFNIKTVFFKRRTQIKPDPTENETELLCDLVEKLSPALIGLSVMSPFKNISEMLTERIRKLSNSKIPVIWGGIHPTLCPEESISVADAIVRGEGETTIRQLIKFFFEDCKLPTHIPNTWVRRNRKIFKNPIVHSHENLDKLPLPDFSGKNMYFIEDDQLKEQDPYIEYIRSNKKYIFKAQRGCPFSCTYCGNKPIRDIFQENSLKYQRKRSLENLMNELILAKEKFPEIESMTTFDEVFISDKKFIEAFAERYRNEIDLPLTCDIHLNMLDEKTLSLMKEAGLRAVSAGIEAFSEKVRMEVYKRKQSDSMIIEKARLLEKYKIAMSFDFILDCPYENENDLKESFHKLISKLPRSCTFNMYSLSHLPKTELTERLLEEGIIQEDDIVGTSDKGFRQWKADSSYKRSPKTEFWLTVFRLFEFRIAQRFHIPLFILKILALTENPRLAVLVRKTANRLDSLLSKTSSKNR